MQGDLIMVLNDHYRNVIGRPVFVATMSMSFQLVA